MNSNLNFLFALLVVILIVTIALASRGCGGRRIPAFIDPLVTLEEAQSRSGQSGRPVFALVAADWSEPSKALKNGALSNSKVVAYLKEHTEPVYVDVTRSDQQDADALAVMSRLGVQGPPAMVLIRKGLVVARFEGEAPAKDVLKWLQEQAGGTP